MRCGVTEPGLAHRMTSAIQASIETIRRRVDAFGTTEPSIQREGRNRVVALQMQHESPGPSIASATPPKVSVVG